MAKKFDFTAPCKVTITNIVNPNNPTLVNKDAQTGKRRVMKLAEAVAAGFKDFEYMLDREGNFVVDPVSGATADPANPIEKDNILVIVRESVKYTDRFIQFFATQQKIKLDAGDSITFTAKCPAALAHYKALAVDGEIEVTITGAATKVVATAADITKALEDPSITNIELTQDVDMPNTIKITNNSTEFNGGGNTIKATVDATGANKDGKDGILSPNADNVVIKDVTVDVQGVNKETWQGNYGIQLYQGSATVENVVTKNANVGILVNGSKATFVGKIDVSDNGFGGVEVSQGTATVAPVLDATKATFVNTTEAYGKPTLYIDGYSKLGLACVKAPEGMTGVEFKGEKGEKDQYHFYLNPANAVAPTK